MKSITLLVPDDTKITDLAHLADLGAKITGIGSAPAPAREIPPSTNWLAVDRKGCLYAFQKVPVYRMDLDRWVSSAGDGVLVARIGRPSAGRKLWRISVAQIEELGQIVQLPAERPA